jgi:hypothetical protein
MFSTRKTSEHPSPPYNLPIEAAGAAEVAEVATEAAVAAGVVVGAAAAAAAEAGGGGGSAVADGAINVALHTIPLLGYSIRLLKFARELGL